MSDFSVDVVCRHGDAELLDTDSDGSEYARVRISASDAGGDSSVFVAGERIWTGSARDLDSVAATASSSPNEAVSPLLANASAQAHPAAVREALLVTLLGYRAGNVGAFSSRSDEAADALLRDIFLLPTKDGLERQPHLYIPLCDPFFDVHEEAFERLVDLSLLGRIVWCEGAEGSCEIVRYFTRLNVPLVAGYRYDKQSPISGPTHRVWRRIRFYMEMGFRRFLPEELCEKMGGKPVGKA